MSYRSAINYVELVLRSGLTLEQADATAIELNPAQKQTGFGRAALDGAMASRFANGVFEELGDDIPAVVAECYPGNEVATVRLKKDGVSGAGGKSLRGSMCLPDEHPAHRL